MIRSCEDINSVEDFDEFIRVKAETHNMGLKETARILRWSNNNSMCPNLLHDLIQNRRRQTLKND